MAGLWDERGSSSTLDRGEAGLSRASLWTGAFSGEHRNAPHDPQAARLSRAVETEVLPRLLLGHHRAPAASSSHPGWHVDPSQIVELAACSIGDEDAAADYVATLRASGAGVEAVYLDLLGPAARHLGECWEDDTLSFVDVTIGLVRLHQVMRSLACDFRTEAAVERPGRRALLVPAPGEQHGFGLAMVTEFFRRAGWSVWSGAPSSVDELLGLVRGEWFGVVGFSVACDTRLESLAACIRKVRKLSRNPAVGVMVGGPIFLTNPDLAVAVGADATATDGRHATYQAEGLLALQLMNC